MELFKKAKNENREAGISGRTKTLKPGDRDTTQVALP
jgi:hypothetical protein